MKATFLAGILAIFTMQNAAAHGENKPGPHGGVIRMPGAFHTEIKSSGAKSFDVYLLDIEWENPTTKNSTLSAKHFRGQAAEYPVECKIKGAAFQCSSKEPLKKGDRIEIVSSRSGAVGGAVTYEFPFKVMSHGSHH